MEEGSQITGEPQGEAMALSRWTLVSRIVIYTAAVVFLVSLLVVGRTKPSKTATSPTTAKADLTVTKYNPYAITGSTNTVKTGGRMVVRLQFRNPGSVQTVKVRDAIFPGFSYDGFAISNGILVSNLTTPAGPGGVLSFDAKLDGSPGDNMYFDYYVKAN